MLVELLVLAEGPDAGKVSAWQLAPARWGGKEGPPTFVTKQLGVPPGVNPLEYRWNFNKAQLMDDAGNPPPNRPTPAAIAHSVERTVLPPANTNGTPAVPDPDVIAKLETFCRSIEPYPTDRFAERGIVTCAGGATLQANGYVLFRLLRRLGCTLPIECFYDGLTERDEAWERLVSPLGVKCIDARKLGFRGMPFHAALTFRGRHIYQPGRVNGYMLKPFAILHSSFERALFLDADNMPVSDPSFLLDEQSDPVTLWEDIGAEPCLAGFGLAPMTGVTTESGQIVVDKPRAWPAIVLAEFFAEHTAYFSQFSWGEKEFHLIACWWTDTPCTVIRGSMRDKPSLATMHNGPDGSPLFCHLTATAKWQPYGPSLEVQGFPFRDECLGYLDEWRSWRKGGTE